MLFITIRAITAIVYVILVFVIAAVLLHKAEPQETPESDIKDKYEALVKCIEAAKSIDELGYILNMVDVFIERYKDEEMLNYYKVKLECAVQLKRTDLLLVKMAA